MGGRSQLRQGDGKARLDLRLQIGHGGRLGAVVDDAVDHAVVVLQQHLRVFEVVLRLEKIGKLPEADAVNVMTGYYAVLLQGNDVADG